MQLPAHALEPQKPIAEQPPPPNYDAATFCGAKMAVVLLKWSHVPVLAAQELS